MTITWLGHACFLLEEDGCRLITDPYTGVAGYPDTHTEAHAVYCSHGHFDHCFTQGVKLLSKRECPFSVTEVAVFHDDQGGALRGENTIRVFSAGGVRVCHLGDLGHPLSGEQAAAIGPLDVLLIPVGGFFTIGPELAAETVRRLKPRCAVPMHYRHAPYGLSKVGGVDPFLSLFPAGSVKKLDGPSFTVTADLPPVLVPVYQA